MDTRSLARYAALPDDNAAPDWATLHAKCAVRLDLTAARAESSTWGLTGDHYIVASLLKLLARSLLAEDEASRKLAGAQMKVGRLEKKLERVGEPDTAAE